MTKLALGQIARKTTLLATALLAMPAIAISVLANPAFAQEATGEAPEPLAPEEFASPEIDWSHINVDALDLIRGLPHPGDALRAGSSEKPTQWNRSENCNGSANVARTRSWESGIATHVGVDSVGSQSGWAPPGMALAPGSGSGWASAAIPGSGLGLSLIDQATIDARLDPESDQRKFGARFEKSLPINQHLSVTLQNGYGLSQPFANQTPTGPHAPVFDNEQLAKLNVLNFGTSLFAGSKQSSTDERRLNSFGAEQNLLGGVSVSGAVSENASGGHDGSLTARFRKSW